VLYLCLPHLRNDFPRIAGPNVQLVAFLTFSATSGPCSSLQDLRGGTSQNDTTASKHATTQASCAARRYRKESPGAPPRCINTVSAPKRTRGFRSRLSRSPPSPPVNDRAPMWVLCRWPRRLTRYRGVHRRRGSWRSSLATLPCSPDCVEGEFYEVRVRPGPFVVDRSICHFFWYGGVASEGS
jgi:hypothetical protein